MFRRKWFKPAGIALLAFTMISVPAAQASGIMLNVDGNLVQQSVQPTVLKGTVLVPAKQIADTFGAVPQWDNETKTLKLTKNDIIVAFILGSPTATVTTGSDTAEVTLEQPAQMINNNLMVPVRFLADLYGATVEWNQSKKMVMLTTNAAETKGITGPKGDKGEIGDKGEKGDKGDKGDQGPAGSTGPSGATGNKGDQGSAGPAGPAGPQGSVGPAGQEGPQGPAGAVGPAGPAGPQGPVGPTGPEGPQGPAGAVGPAGPQGPAGSGGTNFAETGFSAFLPQLNTAQSARLTGWSTAAPYYGGANFNPTGSFVVPATGKYTIKATINYQLTAPQNVSLGAGVNPYFSIKRTAPSQTELLKGYLPILDVNIALVLTLRAALGSGTVTLEGDASLTAGDTIELFYESSGMTLGLNISNVVWSMHQITGNSPT
ncbi:stalk domain-containing protein [Paenibacillus spongiae]|uniref:stalk domain-containing protein n=1 Tax=Paenibacillus spongiae TaxID=2909671 RepID=UPI00283A9AB3|nr:stalk domain-containing protein [Paenibacillus spongiae]